MNLPYVYELLAAADGQPHGFTRIRLSGVHADYEVRLMAQAGLVKASFEDGTKGSFTSIQRVTRAGHTFLRAFKGHPILDEETVEKTFTASQAAIVAEWKSIVL